MYVLYDMHYIISETTSSRPRRGGLGAALHGQRHAAGRALYYIAVYIYYVTTLVSNIDTY